MTGGHERGVAAGAMRGLRTFGGLLRRSAMSAVADDVSNVAQSAAYSALFALFPALILAAATVPLLPGTGPLRYEVSTIFQGVLPADVLPLLEGYFTPEHEGAIRGVRALVVSALLSLLGCSGVIATLMEGLRRANDLPADCWTFPERRFRALVLVPLALLPLGAASLLVVFGRYLTLLLVRLMMPEGRRLLLVLAGPVRWGLAVAGSVWLIALLYKLGTPLRQRWAAAVPGAVLATALWLAATLGFGLYVTRFANYSRVYGSLGAGVALLLWLFLIFVSVLVGAEFNAQLRNVRTGVGTRRRRAGDVAVAEGGTGESRRRGTKAGQAATE